MGGDILHVVIDGSEADVIESAEDGRAGEELAAGLGDAAAITVGESIAFIIGGEPHEVDCAAQALDRAGGLQDIISCDQADSSAAGADDVRGDGQIIAGIGAIAGFQRNVPGSDDAAADIEPGSGGDVSVAGSRDASDAINRGDLERAAVPDFYIAGRSIHGGESSDCRFQRLSRGADARYRTDRQVLGSDVHADRIAVHDRATREEMERERGAGDRRGDRDVSGCKGVIAANVQERRGNEIQLGLRQAKRAGYVGA